ncbi:hypothetical protein AB0M47_21035 [Hamadaea sp. NPDC051192]|uniref:hypothetical protein n=1 Tax=Hamadaea sp. NPDC051192 TaxID=3154940 RepID=UPI00344646A5
MAVKVKVNQQALRRIGDNVVLKIDQEIVQPVARTHSGRPVSDVVAELHRRATARGLKWDGWTEIATAISEGRPVVVRRR